MLHEVEPQASKLDDMAPYDWTVEVFMIASALFAVARFACCDALPGGVSI